MRARARCWYHRCRLWALQHIPAGFLADPFGWFLAFLCLFSGVPILFGFGEPHPIRALLPHWFVVGWGACLTLGGLGMMCGLSSIRHVLGGQWVVTRVPCFRLGLRLLAISSLVYAYAVASVAGLQAAGVVVILALFAAASVLRLLTLGGR